MNAGEFLEYAQVHGHYYGTWRDNVVSNLKDGHDVLIDIDTQGAANVRSYQDEFIRQALQIGSQADLARSATMDGATNEAESLGFADGHRV